MLQTTGISRQQAIDAARTIIGYYNTYALDTVARILRREDNKKFIKESIEEKESELLCKILDLHIGFNSEQLNRHIDDYGNMKKLRDGAENILKVLCETEYLGRDNEEQETAQGKS